MCSFIVHLNWQRNKFVFCAVSSTSAVGIELLLAVGDSARILLLVGFDDLSYCQVNIRSEFHAFTLATRATASCEQNFYTNGARAANKF